MNLKVTENAEAQAGTDRVVADRRGNTACGKLWLHSTAPLAGSSGWSARPAEALARESIGQARVSPPSTSAVSCDDLFDDNPYTLLCYVSLVGLLGGLK